MPALTKEIALALGFKKQSGIATALVAADMFRLRQTNPVMPLPNPIRESDKDDIGTDIYATQTFPSHTEAKITVEQRLTSANFAWLSTFWCGATVKTAADTGWKYTSVAPQLANFVANGIDLPTTTILAAVRQGGTPVSDVALVGMACEEFTMDFKSGPGRDNATISSQWMGTGKSVSPSTITMPAATTEYSLNSGQMTVLSLLGVDYIANQRFLSLSITCKNNIREGLMRYPGSGSQDGFQLGGRMWRGTPEITVKATVLAEAGSAEQASLISGAEGPLTFTIVGAAVGTAFHTCKVTLHRVQIKAAPASDQDGLIAYDLDVEPLNHVSNGYATFEATTNLNNILTTAS